MSDTPDTESRTCPICGGRKIWEETGRRRYCPRVHRAPAVLPSLIADREAGMAYLALSDKYGISAMTLRRWLLNAGAAHRMHVEHPRRRVYIDWKRLAPAIRRALASGDTRKQIAERLGISPITLRAWLYRTKGQPVSVSDPVNRWIAELWLGHSAAEIAAITLLSRNAVIGRAARMGLPHKAPPRTILKLEAAA